MTLTLTLANLLLTRCKLIHQGVRGRGSHPPITLSNFLSRVNSVSSVLDGSGHFADESSGSVFLGEDGEQRSS